MVKNIIMILGAFFVGALMSALILVKYSNFDFLSTHHNEPYLLNTAIQIKDATNNKTLSLPEGLAVKLNNDYEGSSVVSVEFIIDILELDKVATKQEKEFPNRYWYVGK